jgi:hypothetical protein
MAISKYVDKPARQSPLMAFMKSKARDSLHSLIHRYKALPSARELHCVDCNEPAFGYDHYLGYSLEHAFDVEPVCHKCDGKRRIQRGESMASGRQRGDKSPTWQRPLARGNVVIKPIGPMNKDRHFLSLRARRMSIAKNCIGPRHENGDFYSWMHYDPRSVNAISRKA